MLISVIKNCGENTFDNAMNYLWSGRVGQVFSLPRLTFMAFKKYAEKTVYKQDRKTLTESHPSQNNS